MPYTHHKVGNKQCVYKKDTNKKVGCTTGPVKKYLAALHMADEGKTSKVPVTISQKDTLNSVRKPMPPPSKSFKDKGKYDRKSFKTFKDYVNEINTLGGQKVTDDTTATAEGIYAQGQDNVPQAGGYTGVGFSDSGPTFTVEKKKQKDSVITKCINFLSKYQDVDVPSSGSEQEEFIEQLKHMAAALQKVGIEPVDIYAAIEHPAMAQRYLVTGPSAPGGGGRGALKDLKDIQAGLLTDDESNPGGPDTTAATTQGIQGEGIHDARHPGRLKSLVTKRFGKGKITCSKAKAMKSSKNTLTKKQAQRFINYHC